MTEKKIPSRMLMLIAAPKFAEKATALLRSCGIPIQYILHGRGTAPSEIMDLLGLGSAEKTVVLCFLPKSTAGQALALLKDGLEELERKSRGIVLTLPLNGLNKLLLRMMGDMDERTLQTLDGKEEPIMSDRKFSLITAIVNQGYSDDVMNAARSAGARGGTVIHSRRIAEEIATERMGLGVQEERELILIAAADEDKVKIMQAIGEACGIHTEAKGMVLSLPIDGAVGLN